MNRFCDFWILNTDFQGMYITLNGFSTITGTTNKKLKAGIFSPTFRCLDIRWNTVSCLIKSMAEACWRHKHKRTKKNVKRVLILITKTKSLHAQLNFCTFLCCHYTTTTWKRLISCSIEGKTSHDQVHFSFWAWIWFLGIQPRERWPKFDKVSELE